MGFKNFKILSGLFLMVALLWIGWGRSEMGENFRPEEGGKVFAVIDPDFEPAYLELHRSGELRRRAEKLWQSMESCRLCPRRCGVNRLEGETGFCRAPGTQLYISSAHAHFGEERPLVGRGGSGTIFFPLPLKMCVLYKLASKSSGPGSVKEY